MIVYSSSVKEFRLETEENRIAFTIEDQLIASLGRRPSPSEKTSWINSMQFMNNAVRQAEIPEDCGVLIEFTLPLSSKRIDFMLVGRDESERENAIIVELKQWQTASLTPYGDLVKTHFQGRERETPHPSYQAASYKTFLNHFVEEFYLGGISSHACAYLHNYRRLTAEPLLDPRYEHWLSAAPIYFNQDQAKLARFLNRHLKKGRGAETLYRIQNSRIRPSKKLIDHVASLYRGNEEFVLLDEQKVAFEKAKHIALYAEGKNVLIIEGGPGTGKSVISMNLLKESIKGGANAAFVAPSASFREAMQSKLGEVERKGVVSNLFKGAGAFLEAPANTFDCLIVDEAHRLSGPHQWYRGESQAKDIVNAARTSVFFVDDDQAVRLNDIGNKAELERRATEASAKIHYLKLSTQFRCGGAQGYINWLEHVWHLRDTGNYDGWPQNEFEFKIFDSPVDLYAAIQQHQQSGFRARMMAGYAWPWTSERENPNGEALDVAIPEHGFAMPWNSRRNSMRWAVEDWGDSQIGCIYTSQGLEFDYAGILVGPEIGFDFQQMEWVPHWSEYRDHGGRSGLKGRPDDLRQYICRIYRVLMSRGMKGCYVYFCRDSAKRYFSDRFNRASS